MAFNLANERIQDTYEQLVQISGSTLLNGIGTAIPAITNINSVSSSYAITASYAQYAVSASHEIVHELSSSYADTASFANFATIAGTATSATTAISASFAVNSTSATSATTATSASHALFANQAGTATSATSATTATSASHALFANQAGTATTATTASYINPTFISASAAASGFGAGATPTLQQVTDVGASTTTAISSSGGMIVESTIGTLGFRAQATLLSNPAFSRLLPTSLTFSGSSSTQSNVNSLAGELALSVPSDRRVFLQTAGSPRLIALNQEVYTQDAVFRATLSAQVTGSLNVNGTITASGDMLMTNPNGNQTLTITGSNPIVIQGSPDFVTTFADGGIYLNRNIIDGATSITLNDSANIGVINANGSNRMRINSTRGTGILEFTSNGNQIGEGFASAVETGAFKFRVPVTGSIISASSGFIGNGSGLTNINTAFGAELYFNAADYVIDLPGDANDAAYTVSISQSGVYLISSSKVPPYAASGPRVNLQWCPQQLGSGVAKVKFFVPSLDTGTGITYKQSVSCSADYQYIWNSTTTPSASTSTNIARSLTLPQYSNGSGVTNMIKGQDGFVYFSTTGTPVPSQGYIYTGPSIGLLV